MNPFALLPPQQIMAMLGAAYMVGRQTAPVVAGYNVFQCVMYGTAGVAAARPSAALVPFRIVGRGLGFLFGLARNNPSVTAGIDALQWNVTDETVSIVVRRDIAKIIVSITGILVVAGSAYILYRVLAIAYYKAQDDIKAIKQERDLKKQLAADNKETMERLKLLLACTNNQPKSLPSRTIESN